MKRLLALGLTSLTAAALAACGEDDTDAFSTPLIASRPATPTECPQGGVVTLSGIDANGDGALADAEVASTQVICNADSGDPGDPGDPGLNALVLVTAEPAGANCQFGGQKVETGLDANRDGALDTDEVESTSYVCDGPPGPDGLSYLVRTSTAVGNACEAQGLVIQSGLDTDRNGTLDDGEVTSETIVCAGVEGFDVLVDIAVEAPGVNCSAGGQRLRRGVDRNRSGQLDPAEVEDTTYICNPVATLILTSSISPGAECANGGVRIETGLDADASGTLEPSEVNATRVLCEGTDGLIALVAVSTVAAGAGPCLNGGQRIDSGVDTNVNGVLDPAEITSTSYACSASPGAAGRGTSAVRISSEPAGPNCANGGTRIETGPDTNGDGALQTAEVTETRFACSGDNSAALIDVQPIPAGAVCLNGGQRILEGLDLNGNGTLDAAEVTSTTDICASTNAVQMVLLTAALPSGFRTAAFSASIEAIGGLGGNYQWTVGSGSLPPGVSLGATGTPSTQLSGTPTSTGTFTFDVVVSDGFGGVASREYSVVVAAPPCEPGRNGVVGETLSTLTAPSNFGSGITGISADTSATGWIYVIDSGSTLERFSKTGDPVTEENVLSQLSPITAGLINSVHVIGNDIYLTNDSTSCTTDCIRRISDDGGATFSVQDLGDFSAQGPTNDALQGVVRDGNTLWMITNDPVDAQLWALDLSASTFPTTATLAATITNIDTCNGLQLDSQYFYSACDDIGNGSEGLVRINRTTFAAEPVADLTLSISSGSWGDVAVVDTNSDGVADVAYVQGDNNGSTTSLTGATYFVCNPAGTVPAFSQPFGVGVADDEGLAYDASTNSLWQVDESSPNIFRFD